MVEENTKDWRELCRAASTEKDSNKLLSIVSKVITILESEEGRKRLASLSTDPALRTCERSGNSFAETERAAAPKPARTTIQDICFLGIGCNSALRKTNYLRKWLRIASAWLRVTTDESAATSACLTACTLPKCSNNRRVVC
jgi:hypothetical protein